ncbi:sigma-70 family RNA polymerase sigma factor [Streptomyces sp. Go-475]|uniref:RNA polymerase sigma factor n=1 Tax=Streptomyces sp. Go-475 TaxID=2072505 RepID=UPI000DF02B10|nr:sigma-70 family RNA polymerase sigma factor [Streptomyces sp. Go-475]AXE84020.1 RNA polymerase sigma factor [Streptomyces sp. Go-475]
MPSAHEDEFDAFFRQEISLLVRHLVVQGFGRQAAKDAAQEAMIELHEQWSNVRNPAAWVRIAARRRALRGREQEVRHDVVNVMAAVPCPAIDLRTPEEEVTRKQERQEVLGLLGALPRVQQQIMAWTWDGAKPAEIALRLGIPADTVRSNLRHARNRLKQLWAESREEESDDG